MIKKYFFEKSSSNINNLENVKETILEKLLFSQKDQKKIILICTMKICGLNYIMA